jgi:hypothetical protein
VISIAVGALEGKIELYLEQAGTSYTDPLIIEPSHEGLLTMWQLFQSMGPVPVRFMPEISDPGLTGFPAGVDGAAFVSAAQLMSELGWYSCTGGTA